MKLTKLKGIAHDLEDHLHLQTFNGYWSDLEFPVETNVLENKDSFDKSCIAFFKERLPKDFDFKRIKEIIVKITRYGTSIRVDVNVKVDDTIF